MVVSAGRRAEAARAVARVVATAAAMVVSAGARAEAARAEVATAAAQVVATAVALVEATAVEAKAEAAMVTVTVVAGPMAAAQQAVPAVAATMEKEAEGPLGALAATAVLGAQVARWAKRWVERIGGHGPVAEGLRPGVVDGQPAVRRVDVITDGRGEGGVASGV
eukprot:2932262-Prymnesium_polylepis.1